jgi:hypothetical protein
MTPPAKFAAVTAAARAASVGPLSCQPWQRQPPPPHRVTACSIMPAFIDFPGDAAIIGNIKLALYDLPQ